MSSDSETSDGSNSSDSNDEEWEVVESVIMETFYDYEKRHLSPQPYRNDPFGGRDYVNRVLNGNDNRCPYMFRMKKAVLYDLADTLKIRGLLQNTRYVTVEEQLCIFLYTIGHNHRNRVAADRFQHSQETISRHFGTVLKAICRFAKEVVLPPNFNTQHPYIMSKGDQYYPWFQNCVGAIDGTHVSASAPSGRKQIPYIGRKSTPTQNVMCACDFDMCFTFVLAGWEGTANDSRVFAEALSNPQLKFPHPPQGKFFLVDSGYPNRTGFLAPYKGDRYHRSEYSGRNKQPRTAREKLDQSHSSLRNVIERTFGVLKNRFPILRLMPNYSLRKQRNIVIAACAIHNFIRRHKLQDDMFRAYEDENMIIPEEVGEEVCEDQVRDGSNQASTSGSIEQRRREMGALRDEICRSMAMYYRLPM